MLEVIHNIIRVCTITLLVAVLALSSLLLDVVVAGGVVLVW